MFQLLGGKQALAGAIKLKWDIGNLRFCRNRTSEISKLVKTQTVMTVRMRVTLMMNVDMKAVMKNANNREKRLFEITTFLVNLLAKVTSF